MKKKIRTESMRNGLTPECKRRVNRICDYVMHTEFINRFTQLYR